MTAEQFKAAVDDAAAGEQIVYHRGCLMFDRGWTLGGLGGGHHERSEQQKRVHGVAAMAWFLYETGVALLVQRKIAEHNHEYIAIKRAPKPGGKATSRSLVVASVDTVRPMRGLLPPDDDPVMAVIAFKQSLAGGNVDGPH